MRSLTLILACFALCACAGQSGAKKPLAAALPAPAVLAADAERQGNWTDAARHWEQAAAAAPEDGAIALHTVRALRRSNSCGRATSYLQRLFESGTESADVLIETGKCHLISGRYQAAEAALSAALAADPNNWEAETILGTTYDLMDAPRAALAHHERAALIAPHNAMVLSNRALSLALSGDLRGGLDAMRRAAGEPTAPLRTRMNLAFLEAVAGNGDVAGMMARQEATGDTESLRLLQRISAAARTSPTL